MEKEVEAVVKAAGLVLDDYNEVTKRYEDREGRPYNMSTAAWVSVKDLRLALDALDRSLAKPGEDAVPFSKLSVACVSEIADRQIALRACDDHEILQDFEKRLAAMESHAHELQIWKAATPDQYDLERGHVARVGALEERLGVGEKGGTEKCEECGRSYVKGYTHFCGNSGIRVDPPAPAPSRAPGNGETADVRANRAWESRMSSDDPVVWAIADEIRAAESAARADENQRAAELVSSHGLSWLARELRALLAGGQEVKGC